MIHPNPLFSVVIPLYNKENYLANTLHSVLNQTFKDFEVIIVNDGSTDKSLEMAQSFIDPRIKIYSKVNEGVSVARNFGISKAMGNYIAFLDADDLWEATFLEEINNLIIKYPSCGFYASAYKRIKFNKCFIVGDKLPEGIVKDFFEIKLKNLVPMSSGIAVRKDALENVGGFPKGMVGGEDDFTWSKIAVNYKVAFTPKVLATFNEYGSTVESRKGKIDTCKESWFDLYKDGDFYRNELIAKKAIYAGIRYAYSSYKSKSREIEQKTKYAVLSKNHWRRLYYLNRLPLFLVVLYDTLILNLKRVKHKMIS